MNRSGLFRPLVAIPLVIMCGCRPSQDIGHVSGRVTWEGNPVANATVTFRPAEGRSSYGITDDEGQYELMQPGGERGAAVGIHAISIETYRIYTDESGEPREHAETIPARYNANSELTHEVKPGQQTVDFALPLDLNP